jgi:hypothetical protein
MKQFLFFWIAATVNVAAFCQGNVGIGTPNPNAKAILDLSSTTLVFLPPRMNETQIKAITSMPYGSLVYNSSLQSHMAYVRLGSGSFNFITQTFPANNKWLPITPGPKVLAWGVVDSTTGNPNVSQGILAPLNANSGNFSIRWHGNVNNKNWYELNLHNDEFKRDSMILMITPIGNGSWDVAVSVGEVLVNDDVHANIKFTDVTRSASGSWQSLDTRRRSNFYFVLYDLRGY